MMTLSIMGTGSMCGLCKAHDYAVKRDYKEDPADDMTAVETIKCLLDRIAEDEGQPYDGGAAVADLAERIFNIDIYEMWDADVTAEDIAEDIKNDPEQVIKYLLDIIDDLQA